jgi:hypothetical protein
VGFIPVLQDRDFLENGKEHSEFGIQKQGFFHQVIRT